MRVVQLRAELGVKFCPTCRVDTLPDARNGQCFFCDTVIAAPDLEHVPAVVTERACAECGKEFVLQPYGRTKTYCSKLCKDRAWSRTDAGLAWRQEKRRRADAKRAYLASLGIRRSAGSPW